MPIEVSTVYTKDRSLRFSDFMALSQTFYWVFTAICLCLLFGMAAFLVYWNAMTFELKVMFAIYPLLIVIRLIFWFVVPRFTVKKNKNLDLTVQYTFQTDHFQIHALNTYAEENSTISYSSIDRIRKNETDLYLFISKRQAFIVDLTALSPEQVPALRNLLTEKVAPGKVKWGN